MRLITRKIVTYKVYLVGGAVRDKILGREVKEKDWVVVGATPDEMLAQGFKQVGKDFPVFLHPKTNEEYALARTERKIGPGYTGFEVHAAPDVTLEEDLQRRDLTINAIAEDEKGHLTDPYGGVQDIKNKILRHVSPAFVEDPVRILRLARLAARFADLNFQVHPDTNLLMREMVVRGEVDALVPERIWQELSKALDENIPSRFFWVLHHCGALQKLFPELENLFGVPCKPEYHPEVDTFIHTMMVVDAAARHQSDSAVRFATLLHDLGKGITKKTLWPAHHGHDEAGVKLIKQCCQRIRAPKPHQELAVIGGRYHTTCHRAEELRPSTRLKLLEAVDAFRRPERLEQFLEVCLADFRGRPGRESSPYPQADLIRKAFSAAAKVNAKAIVASGLTGNDIKLELHRQRVSAIKAA